jgi:o-aminophenol oxidase
MSNIRLENLKPFKDDLVIPEILKPKKNECGNYDMLEIEMKNASIKLHSDLPPTQLWTYGGKYPGPTIEVTKDQKVVVKWKNELNGVIPIDAFEAVSDENDPPQNHAGKGDGDEKNEIDSLKAWTVVHLHGGRTLADSDGWTENMFEEEQFALSTYHNHQRARMLWYHDHAMGVTRFNVFAGLAGLWMIRDDEEESLNLPDKDYEIPLLIQDKNLDTDENDNLTGKLLHKVESDTMEFFGPITLVNGIIWPRHKVKARKYRLRIVNGSNARIYRLLVVDDDRKKLRNDIITQIGSDGGLLSKPLSFADDEGLIIAPAERVDLIVDFSKVRGAHLRLINSAGAPFDGTPIPTNFDPYTSDPQTDPDTIKARLKFPNVIKFEVSNQLEHNDFVIPSNLSDLHLKTHDEIPPEHCHRVVFLAEIDGTLELVELVEISEDEKIAGKYIEIKDKNGNSNFYKVGARLFEDQTNWFPKKNSWEIWKVINATMDTHPFHVHLVDFNILRRDLYDLHKDASLDLINGNTDVGKPVTFIEEKSIDANEHSLKDTIRVNPGIAGGEDGDDNMMETKGTTIHGEMVTIAINFTDFTGRYMYHCHLLEHEDHEMMRSFVVLPEKIMEVMEMDPCKGHVHMGHGH